MNYHPACRDCVAKDDCLFLKNDDAESCGDVQDFDSGLDLPDPSLRDKNEDETKTNLAFDEDGEQIPTEREALSIGITLMKGKYTGDSDFDKGMRLFQQGIQSKNSKPKFSPDENGAGR